MRGHIIPKVYQKKWHTNKGENNVLYYDKNNLSNPLCKDGGNVEKNLYEIDEYIINKIDKGYGLNCTDDYELEHYFRDEYENKWNDIVINSKITEFLESAEKQAEGVIAIQRDDLKETPFESELLKYIIIQFFRIYDNFKLMDKGLIDQLCNFAILLYEKMSNTKITEDEKKQVIGNEDYVRTVWKQLLLDCKNDNNLDSILSVVLKGLSDTNLTFIYIKKDIDSKFILSDNPVIWNTGEIKKYSKLESGIFFPILPNLMVAYLKYSAECKLKQGDAICLFGNDDFVKYMNHILHKQSLNKIGFMKENVIDNIDENVDFSKAWNSLFKK